MRSALLVLVLALPGCSQRDPAVLLNAPSELHGARVVVDGKDVGTLSARHSYRHGVYADSHEFGAPPRHEANLAIHRLSSGTHRLQIIAAGRPMYHATFRTRGAHTEVFIEDRVEQRDAIPDVCGAYPDLSSLTDPSDLGRLIVRARLFQNGGALPEGGRIDEETWLRGTDGACAPCETCEAAVTKGLYRLAELNSEAAAREAAAIAVDPRMGWDGGPALLMEDAVSRFGPLVVPYLEPYEKTSLSAARILVCARLRVRCL